MDLAREASLLIVRPDGGVCLLEGEDGLLELPRERPENAFMSSAAAAQRYLRRYHWITSEVVNLGPSPFHRCPDSYYWARDAIGTGPPPLGCRYVWATLYEVRQMVLERRFRDPQQIDRALSLFAARCAV